MRGVPVRIELGAKDLEAGVATLVRRDKAKGEDGGKTAVALAALPEHLRALLVDIQRNLFAQAREFLHAHSPQPREREAFFRACRERAGMIDIPWCGLPACEAAIKAETSATTRNTRPLRAEDSGAACVACGEPAALRAYFAQSY
jgi:prolyl-tRNA synthetase